jgi:hypothetical protein
MEQTLDHSRQLQSVSRRPTTTTAAFYPSLLVLTLVSLFVGIMAVTAFSKAFGQEQPPADPFALYTDLFPGQLVDIRALEARGFSCQMVSLPTLGDMNHSCSAVGRTEAVSLIRLAIRDGIVSRLDFRCREGAFLIGDLVLRWGTPDVQISRDGVDLIWRTQHIIASGAAEAGWFSYLHSVEWLSLES